ncbi:TIGR02302 family protein [Siccirubricoccus sp. KC 17139]|uniref:TIGR02302 family protein n=1 Tax=Siccirubricoccus soli TaxID=2899147 RepID=A0ABT1D9H6_9PROT|nr:TIGR02302 family protein [Siccirubricoccus soli]MCO6418581.1 TIGR02302 family protein [Siccirubricoccus soli]MCP2684716.1 TIGR02302 family protein [Siccirubricoccus soli]
MQPDPLPGALGGRLRRQRRLARLALWWETLWPRAWPPLGLLGLFAILALLDVPARLPPWLHLLLLAGFGAGLGFLLWRGFHGLAWPDEAGAERRLERDSGLRHRPLAALSDRPAGDDPTAFALWQVHRQRAAAALGRLTLRAPRPGLPARDPRALRAAVLLGLVAALVIAGADAPRLLLRAFQPSWAGLPPAPGLKLEAWVTPPAYTGAAPIFLDPNGGAATVPAGSKLQVSLSGGMGLAAPELVTGAGTQPFRALDGGSFTAETMLTAGQPIAIRRNGSELVQWSLSVQADAPPSVAFAEPPGRAQRGLATRLPWRAEDDWGLAGLRAELRLVARPGAAPLVLDLPLPGGLPKSARGAGQPDLSAHPWAGLEVEAKLVARDGAGQEGMSEPATLALPERSFNHPVAKRLIALRRQLSLDPNRRTPARQELEAIAQAPEAFEHDTATYLALRSARSRLAFDRRAEAVGEVQDILWETALALEEGRDGRTLRALQQAREALREALEQAEQMPRDDPAQAEQRAEIERRIQELRDAIRQHLEALAERLQRENAEAIPFDPQSRLMDQREMDRRTRRMEEAAREGRTEDAKRELAELEEMLKALEEGRTSRSESAERQQRRERGQQQMGVVQDMVRRQSDMLDRSHQRAEGEERERAQRQRQLQRPLPSLRWPPEPPQAQEPPQRGPEAQAETEQDGRRQRALRRALGELMQQFGDLTGEIPEGLGRADQAMREAQEQLRGGADPREAQQRALRALQEGGRQMAQSMQRQFGQGAQQGDEDGDPQDMAGDQPGGGEGQDQAQGQGEGRDPLGRRTRDVNGTADNGADTRVPEEAELLRTRRLQEELRRRGAERERPAEELDYIDRLLKRF